MAFPIPAPSLLPSIAVLCLLINDQDVILPPNALHPDIQQYLFGCILPSGYTTKSGELRVPLYLKNYARPRFPLLIPVDVQLKILRQYQKDARKKRPTAEQQAMSATGTTAAVRGLHRTLSEEGVPMGGDGSQGSSTQVPSSVEVSDAVFKTPPPKVLSPKVPQVLAKPRSKDVEELNAHETSLLYEPHGKWAHMKGRTFKSLDTVQHLSGGANCEVFYEKAETEEGQTFGLINKRWDVWKDWEGFYSEIFLYASSEHLRQLQGIYVPHIIGVHITAQGFVDVMMETPHNATCWTEAHPFTTPNHVKEKIIQAYEAVHAKGVMHFDTELRHILITDQEEICLIDWQLARSLYPNEHVDLKRCNKWQLEGEMRRVKYLLDYQGARAKEILLWVNGDEAKYYTNKRLRERRALGETFIGQLSDEQWDDVSQSWVRVDPREPSWFDQIEAKAAGREFSVPVVVSPASVAPAKPAQPEAVDAEAPPARRSTKRKLQTTRTKPSVAPNPKPAPSAVSLKRVTRSSSRARVTAAPIPPPQLPTPPVQPPRKTRPLPASSRVLRSSNRPKAAPQAVPPPHYAVENDKPMAAKKRKATKAAEELPTSKRRRAHRENA